MFRSSNALSEPSADAEDQTEVKHQYVVQATFDLHEWPECRKENEQT